MIIQEVQPLVKEKQDLIIKLDSKYDSSVEKEKDELRLGELNRQILDITKTKIQEFKFDVQKQVIVKKEEQIKIETVKQARALRRNKRETYKELAKECYKLYMELVQKKKDGVELERKLMDKNLDKYDLQKTISEVRRY